MTDEQPFREHECKSVATMVRRERPTPEKARAPSSASSLQHWVDDQVSDMCVIVRAASDAAHARAIRKSNDQADSMEREELRPSHSAPHLVAGGDRHRLRELEGERLWADRRGKTTLAVASKQAILAPSKRLQDRAKHLLGEDLPEPVTNATKTFDELSQRLKQRAQRALQGASSSDAGARAYNLQLAELGRTRYVVRAPVEHLTGVYPIGPSLDRLTSPSGFRRPQSAGAMQPTLRGVEFTGRPGRGQPPSRPMLPTVPRPQSPGRSPGRRVKYTLLSDSHHAIGVFDLGPAPTMTRVKKVVKVVEEEENWRTWRGKLYRDGPATKRAGWDGRVAGLGLANIYGKHPPSDGGGWVLLREQNKALHSKPPESSKGSAAASSPSKTPRSSKRGAAASSSATEGAASSGASASSAREDGTAAGADQVASPSYTTQASSTLQVGADGIVLDANGNAILGRDGAPVRVRAAVSSSCDGTFQADDTPITINDSIGAAAVTSQANVTHITVNDSAGAAAIGANAGGGVRNTGNWGGQAHNSHGGDAGGDISGAAGGGGGGALAADDGNNVPRGASEGGRGSGTGGSISRPTNDRPSSVSNDGPMEYAVDNSIPTDGTIGPAGLILDADGHAILGGDGRPRVGTGSVDQASHRSEGVNQGRGEGDVPVTNCGVVADGHGFDSGLLDGPRECRGTPSDGQALGTSIWNAKRKGPYTTDSGFFLDTERCLKKCFLKDWGYTTGGAALQADKGQRRQMRPFGEKKLLKEQLEQIMDTLFDYYPHLMRIFTFYSCTDAATTKCCYGISKAGYTSMLNDSKYDLMDAPGPDAAARGEIPRHARMRGEDGFDLLWASVNAASANKGGDTKRDRLCRSEFMEWICRSAVGKQSPEEMPLNVKWFCEDIISFLGKSENAGLIFSNANHFRLDACFCKEVNDGLTYHKATLYNLFVTYASDTGISTSFQERDDLMNYAEWLLLWDHMGFITELTERRVVAAFALSRPLVIDEQHAKSLLLERISFEGFIEAFLRIADIKVLPREEEMDEIGVKNASEFMNAKFDEGADQYRAWFESARRAQEDGIVDPIWRRMDHLMLLIAHIMQGSHEKQGDELMLLAGGSEEKLTKQEALTYKTAPRRPQFTKVDIEPAGKGFLTGNGFRAAKEAGSGLMQSLPSTR